ncbi:protein TIFY 5A-like [Punica granatum]|uniref:Protein TIFY n=1 Tax=Punica granatum TaxID=22663 RepID=A0A218W3F3_PUNGR|nr:protein TIFY 5A-like [Punica granatum]OWM66998.1 hypothetical protein CDL15_Pgr000450 [Punica granatum]
MERNRTLDLSLFTSNTSPSSGRCYQNLSRDDPWHVYQQQITIFHNGRACSFDLTELQARAILLLASRGMGGTTTTNKTRHLEAATVPLKEGSRLYGPLAGLSMKKSLQSFLHERKRRAKASSPYGQ